MALSRSQIETLLKCLRKVLQLNATPIDEQTKPLEINEVEEIIEIAMTILPQIQTTALAELEAPITICGDTHGQYNDVIRLFDSNGWPPATRYLFLGDYVDRGNQSVETFCLMLMFRMRYPKDFFILRGNHESPSICRVYGFYDECKSRYAIRIWRKFQGVFAHLPICALVSQRIFCMHGGLSPSFEGFDQLRDLKLPFEVPDISSLVTDILWCDPDRSVAGYQPNRRGVSYVFGEDVVQAFCEKYNIDLIARAHQVVESGYEFFASNKLVTIFSAPNYCGQFDNSAASMEVGENLKCRIRQLNPNQVIPGISSTNSLGEKAGEV